ncbi:uncharacterized protein LOC144927340 [Branchiostoma floridae x Branchiostoma belcheri]
MYRAGDRLCQRWDSQSPHNHPHTPQAHPDAGLEENFCRNPDNKARPWCYTTDGARRWDYCDVMECADPFSMNAIDDQCPIPNKCALVQTPSEENEDFCQCDNDCGFFGDCCKGFEFEESITTQPSPAHHHLKWKCVPSFSTVRSLSYWMVADCPDHWTDDVIKDQCLKPVDPFNPSDLVYWMPVIDTGFEPKTVHYRNIFCAICNNVSLADVILWETDDNVKCFGLLNMSSSTPRGSLEYINITNSGDCFGTNRLALTPDPVPTSNPRRCLQADLSSDTCDVAACRSYSNPVTIGYGIYKNVHCALCEGLSLTAITNLWCMKGWSGERSTCVGLFCPEKFSLTNLFNFNADGSGENSLNPCPSDAIYDPFTDTCRLFSSSQGSHVYGSSNETASLLNCTEPALTFTSEEFHVLPNGSVHLLSSNVSCPAGQVEILNTTASVCGECVLQHFFNNTQTDSSRDAVQGWLTLGLVSASAVAVVGFVYYTYKSDQWKKLSEKLKVQMMACMATAEVLFVARGFVPVGRGCTALAVLLHYLLLTAFSAMNALAVDLFLTFRQDAERVKLYKHILYTWLVPVPVVLATVIVEFGSYVRVGYGENCWIGNPTASLVAFGIPVLCALLVNVVLVTHVLLAIRKSFQIGHAAKARSDISKAWVYVRISFMMGFTWILGFIYPYVNSPAVQYIFIVLNASQGLLLTVLMTLTGEVLKKWKSAIMARFGLAEAHQDNRRTTTTIRRSTAAKTELTAGGTGSAIEIPMTTLAAVEEDRALGEAHQDSAPTANNEQANADEAMVSGTDSATDIPMTTFAQVNDTGDKDEH